MSGDPNARLDLSDYPDPNNEISVGEILRQLAAKDRQIQRLQEEAKYKCYCCQEQADKDGLCSDGCRCSTLPSWLDAREAAKTSQDRS